MLVPLIFPEACDEELTAPIIIDAEVIEQKTFLHRKIMRATILL